MDSYEWLPTECADERYPMQLVYGQLRCGTEAVRVPSGKIINRGWGHTGSRHLVGELSKAVPDELQIAWFSYTEDAFFAGELELPKAELSELFRAGFKNPATDTREQWTKMIFGMGLGGWLSVWLSGAGCVREVLTFQLTPEELDWTLVLDNPDLPRADFIRSTLQARLSEGQLRAHAKSGPPVSTWTEYARRSPWRLVVEGVQAPLNVSLRTFNGELHTFDFARQPPTGLESVPKRMDIVWQTRGDWRLLTKIDLDEREVYDAFDKVRVADPEASTACLRIDLGPRRKLSLSVESKDAKIPLTSSKIEELSLPTGS